MTTVEPAVLTSPSGRENAALKARRLLIEGRVNIRWVRAGQVYALVRGDSGEIWEVAWETSHDPRGRWTCTCPATTPRCSHLQAVHLVCTRPDPNETKVSRAPS